MTSFAAALRVLEELKRTGVVEDYAVAGAMALVFWTEPTPTYDLDVLVFLPEQENERRRSCRLPRPIARWSRHCWSDSTSSSESALMKQPRARPTAELMERIYRSKEALHAHRTSLSLREKVAAVLELQKIHLPLLRRQRPLHPWEQPWDVEP